MTAFSSAAEPEPFVQLAAEYRSQILPLMQRLCLDCHSTETKQGELDLQRFAAFDDVRRNPPVWQKAAQMLANGEMPPDDAPQLSEDERTQFRDWVQQYLDAEALANAGDPGPVLLRRLNNAEYTDTIQDLTGVMLDPAREFPADGAAGEGFTNTGGALAMSPALVTKYLDAAKEIAGHAVLLPDGIRFSEKSTRRDWTIELLGRIRAIYFRHTGRLGDANRLNQWNVSDPTQLTDEDGRVDIARYFTVLIQHRDRLLNGVSVAGEIAQHENLSPKYLRLLAEMLAGDEPTSVLLNRIRDRFREATAGDAASIAAEIRTWQDRLWTFNAVGHFGLVRAWQEPVTPLANSRVFREKIDSTPGQSESTLFLVTGAAGDGQESDTVVWQRPRFERPGRQPLLLRDLRAVSIAMGRIRDETLKAARQYLAAAFEARTADFVDVAQLAERHNIDPLILKQWLAYLGIASAGELPIKEYLTHRLERVGAYDFVRGWGLIGVDALSVIGNSSDQKVNVPGDMNPHQIAVHPRPERWVAAGWKSPLEGRVRVSARVQDAHPQCGNGVSWTLELRHRADRRVLREGTIDRAGREDITLISTLSVQQGDLVSLVIGPRDGEYTCDLTEIDLSFVEVGGEKREWSLAGDCADSIDAGNPHADRHGNEGVWHFYSDLIESTVPAAAVPPGSILARWNDTSDAASAATLAAEIESLLTSPPAENALVPDAALRQLLSSLNGPLFAGLDPAQLAQRATPKEVANSTLSVDPQLFGSNDLSPEARADDLVIRAPSVVELRVPAELVAGAEFVATAILAPNPDGEGSVQLQLLTDRPTGRPLPDGRSFEDSLLPGVPVVVSANTPAEKRFRESMDRFRELFPSAMCYSRIVPVDVVVTLILFHREDEHLRRLMLSDDEAARLDRLWDELHYVSRDALTIVTGFEQLLEFASQDDDPAKYEPLRETIMQRASRFESVLRDSEPAHLTAVLEFASRAWRRPLTEEQADGLRRLSADLRAQDLSHEDAVRLLLVRVLTSPTFLYKYEQPAPGDHAAPVSDWELVTRLSYFLWSSLPDDELRELAAAGRLSDADTLLVQTRRMVQDDRIRRLAIEFGCQWLHIRDFDRFDEKSERHFPEFAELRTDMYDESVRFLQDMFQRDRSILELLDADHTLLNERLARLYGIEGVTGDEWRVVNGVRKFSRGGILTQAATLATQAGASRTSPILRGNWISETLLGERLPRPPQDVPLLPEVETDTDGLPFRTVVERHSSDPACYKCHRRIDPLGFPLENFDAIGRFRDVDQNGRPFDTRTTLMDGTPIDGLDGLRTYLATTRRDAFVRQFCRKLLGYALGRSVQLSDEPLLVEMHRRLEERDFRFSAALETIVLSRQFREIRGRDTTVTTTE
ncbi:MAG: DUF1592 domain-containing protein [Planctomycetaceae bacterium]